MINCFPDQLHILDIGFQPNYTGRCFMVERPFRCITSKGIIIVPSEFITDGASIPSICQSVFSPIGKAFQAAIFHDWCYSEHNHVFTRKESDDLFLELMYNSGMGWLSRGLIYRSVRLFGGRFFKGSKRND